MTPIQTTPPQDPDVEEETGHDDPIDTLLTQLIDGFFVLTDAQGAVSKWSEPAELLFGLDASGALGKSLFDTLVADAPPGAEAWKRFLESGEAPRVSASQPVSAIYAVDRRSFPLELVFIPVELDEGFDFSHFLEDLSFELPRNLMLMRMRRQHPVVVRALRRSLEAEPQPWDGRRTAGTLVAFRPTQPTPWVEEALAAREAARAAADAERQERLDPDPGIHGDSISELDDAAAVVARLLSAMVRIEDLEKTADGEAARAARREAATQACALREELDTARADLTALRQESSRILEEVAVSRRQAEAAMQRADAGDQRIESLSSELTAALATLDELKAGLTSAREAADIARREAEGAKQAVAVESEKNSERVSEIFRELIGLAGRSSGGGGNVLRQAELGTLRAARDGDVAPLPTRAPRHGFDDVAQPLAVLDLRGRFCELNPAFSKLVGYREHEFVKAVWPSVHDRAVFAEQTDQLEAMVAGELEGVEFQSSYMHSQGLMVAVDGELTLIRDDSDEPVSLLLTAKER